MFSPLSLKQTLAFGHPQDADDVLVTKRSLARLGYLDEGAGSTTAVSDPKIFRGLRKFPRKVGLAPDGIMKPEGPTAAYLGLLLENNFKMRMPKQ